MIDWVGGLARWFHYLAGVMWIGLLYYFNFVQVQALAEANKTSEAAGITKFVAPRAQFFRWSALVTWLMGAAILGTYRTDSSARSRCIRRIRGSASARGSARSCCSTCGC